MYILYFGLILIVGYLLSVVSEKVGFPKIVGYLVAGLMLNPNVFSIIPNDFLKITDTITNFCLAFITFEIGSSFSIKELKKTGRKLFTLAFFEAFGAFILIFIGFLVLSLYILPLSTLGITTSVAFSLIIASLGAPTDPTATLAVIHEYKAKGPVSSAILGAAAFDDIITLILFSFSISISQSILGTQELSVLHILYSIFYKITGAVVTGLVMGFLFNKVTSILKINNNKSLLVIFLASLSLTYGLATFLGFDELFSTLTLGFVIRNYNKVDDKIVDITENGIEELIFLIFFVFSAMNFNTSSITGIIILLIGVFILIRLTGKFLGMRLGTSLLKMSPNVKKYAFAGLIPQGGIVLGLSLLISQQEMFKDFSNLLIGIIMGATIIHEFSGPFISKSILKKTKEIEIKPTKKAD